MGSMLIALGLYIVGIVIMGAVVFYVGKQVLEILSQPVAKIIVGAICAFIVFGTIKELQVGFSWSNIALLAGAIAGIVIILKSLKNDFVVENTTVTGRWLFHCPRWIPICASSGIWSCV